MNQEIPSHPCQRDRNASIRWARTRLAERDFVILDTETTGMLRTTGKPHEVVRICIADCDGQLVFNEFVKQIGRKSMPQDAIAKHSITWNQLKNAHTIDHHISEIVRVCQGKTVVAYNYEFDYGIIAQSCRVAQIKAPNFPRPHCAMLAWSKFVGEPNRNPKYTDKYKFQKQPGLKPGLTSEEDIQNTLSCMKVMASATTYTTLLERFLRWLRNLIMRNEPSQNEL